jgi:hypothetical protein
VKIKLVKVDKCRYYDYDYSNHAQIIPQSDWIEVSNDDGQKIIEGINYLNSKDREFHHLVIYDQGQQLDTYYKAAKDFIVETEKKRKKEEADKAAKKAKSEATALLRKQKQLARLKKELEDNE